MHNFQNEIFYRTARSGGKGGQNVNKVETMVEAWLHIGQSHAFTQEEKELISNKLANRINKDGYLIVKCSETRSQLENKQIATAKMQEIIAKSLIVPKSASPQKSAKPPKRHASIAKRKHQRKNNCAGRIGSLLIG